MFNFDFVKYFKEQKFCNGQKYIRIEMNNFHKGNFNVAKLKPENFR